MGLLLLCTKGELKCFLQSAADDSEAKSNELTGAVEELHKLLKEAGEGKLAKGGEQLSFLEYPDALKNGGFVFLKGISLDLWGDGNISPFVRKTVPD